MRRARASIGKGRVSCLEWVKVMAHVTGMIIGRPRFSDREVATVGSIPEAARGPARDLSGGLAVEEIGDKMFLVADGDYQAMVADTGDGVVAFDAPWQSEYLAAIRRVSTAPVTHVVYSHSHYDHIGGAGHLAAPTVVAHRATAGILARHAEDRRPRRP